MGKRDRLAQLLERTGALRLALGARGRLGSPWLTVLTYHRVAAKGSEGLFDAGTIDVTPDAFERELAFLKRWFDVIGMDDLLAYRRGGKLPGNPVLVTFDDGYLDNHAVALPLLREAGLRATFFIATSYVEERRLFWWDHVSYLLKSSKKDAVDLTYPAAQHLPLGPTVEASIVRALRTIKDHFDLDLPRFLGEMAQAADVSLDREGERRLTEKLLMTWDEVRELRALGMDVQSHTGAHRVLQTQPLDVLRKDLTSAREKLEEVLGERVQTVAYPVGKPIRSDHERREVVRSAGYELGFSYGTGVNLLGRLDPFDVRRFAADLDVTPELFRARMALPYI
jgi:peptidoglycan/xylan/chitin deacetylase (PgdA/CDA1 family)